MYGAFDEPCVGFVIPCLIHDPAVERQSTLGWVSWQPGCRELNHGWCDSQPTFGLRAHGWFCLQPKRGLFRIHHIDCPKKSLVCSALGRPGPCQRLGPRLSARSIRSAGTSLPDAPGRISAASSPRPSTGPADPVLSAPARKTLRSPLPRPSPGSRPTLITLPDNPYPTDERLGVHIGKTPYVRLDGNDYSVPHTQSRRSLTVTASLTTVRVFEGATVIAQHPRIFDQRQQIQDPAHIADLVAAKRAAAAHRGLDRQRPTPLPASEALLHQAADTRHSRDLPIARSLWRGRNSTKPSRRPGPRRATPQCRAPVARAPPRTTPPAAPAKP